MNYCMDRYTTGTMFTVAIDDGADDLEYDDEDDDKDDADQHGVNNDCEDDADNGEIMRTPIVDDTKEEEG